MKRMFILFLLIVLMVACKSNSSNSSKDTLDNKAKNANEKTNSPATLELIKRFKPFFNGVWVSTDYINDLKKSRSPYKSDDLGGVACMDIQLSESNINYTYVGYSLGNHEGADFILYFKNGELTTSLKTNLTDDDIKGNHQDLGYMIDNRDTSLILYLYDKNNNIKGKTNYTKVSSGAKVENDAAWGIQYITNKTLFSGTYKLLDSLGKGNVVKFDNEGNVKGINGFKTYHVETDFEPEPESRFDEIGFDISTPNKKWYHFKINADTINLFETISKPNYVEEEIGKLKYKLVRQK